MEVIKNILRYVIKQKISKSTDDLFFTHTNFSCPCLIIDPCNLFPVMLECITNDLETSTDIWLIELTSVGHYGTLTLLLLLQCIQVYGVYCSYPTAFALIWGDLPCHTATLHPTALYCIVFLYWGHYSHKAHLHWKWNITLKTSVKLRVTLKWIQGVLNFGLAIDEQLKGPKMGACRTDRHQIWGPVELFFSNFFFGQKCCFQLSEVIFGPNEASWTGFLAIVRCRNWKLTKVRHFGKKIEKFCVGFFFFFWLKWRSCKAEKCWKGGLWSGWGTVKKGSSFPLHIPVTLFKLSTPCPKWILYNM